MSCAVRMNAPRVLASDGAGWLHALSVDVPLVIGRGSANIPMTENFVSRHQCEVRLTSDGRAVQIRNTGTNASHVLHARGDGGDEPRRTELGRRDGWHEVTLGAVLEITLAKGNAKRIYFESAAEISGSDHGPKGELLRRPQTTGPDSGSVDNGAKHARNTAAEVRLQWSLDRYPPTKRRALRQQETLVDIPTDAGSSTDSDTVTSDTRAQQTGSQPQPYPHPAPVTDAASSAASSASASLPCLALPLLPLSAASDWLEAARICAEAVRAFLAEHPAPNLRIVIYSADARACEAAQAEFRAGFGNGDSRVSVLCADLVDADGAPSVVCQQCAHVANTTDWRFSCHGSRRLRALDVACGGRLTALSQAVHNTGTAGHSYAVNISASKSPLSAAGVVTVIQIVAPVVDARRADFVNEADHVAQLASSCYRTAMTAFYERAHNALPQTVSLPLPPAAAAARLVEPAVQDTEHTSPLSWTQLPPFAPPSLPIVSFGSFHYASGLHAYLQPKEERTSDAQARVFVEDEECIVIYDAFPKAAVHLLVLSKHCAVASVRDLERRHLTTLDAMATRARWLICHLRQDARLQSVTHGCYRAGYHAVPSLAPLHLHLLSMDLSASALKTKKHFLSFTTDFFVPPARVRAAVTSTETGRAGDSELLESAERCEARLKGELRCHHRGCKQVVKNLPALKQHIARCSHPWPTDD